MRVSDELRRAWEEGPGLTILFCPAVYLRGFGTSGDEEIKCMYNMKLWSLRVTIFVVEMQQ